MLLKKLRFYKFHVLWVVENEFQVYRQKYQLINSLSQVFINKHSKFDLTWVIAVHSETQDESNESDH